MSREYIRLEQSGASFEELETLTLGSLRKAVIDGDVVNGTLMAGQIAGLIQDEKTCREILADITAEAEECYEKNRVYFSGTGKPVSGHGEGVL